jgi:cephalosporin hydroxylase
MNDHVEFKKKCASEVKKQGSDEKLLKLTRQWFRESVKHNYSLHFDWLGVPVIQYPQDMLATQHLLWKFQPDLIIETGVARGGSLIFYASLLELISQCGGPEDASILGIDIDIRPHNKRVIEEHPMAKRIEMISGSSVDDIVYHQVREKAISKSRVLVFLDSNHTHEHVLNELRLYAPLVSVGGYVVVFDTVIEDLPDIANANRSWSKGNSPKSAVFEYLDLLASGTLNGVDGCPLRLEIDAQIENQLLVTCAPSGYLKRI